MLAYKTSSESLIDDNIPAQSVASLRSKFAALSPTVLTPSRTQPRSPSLPTLHIAEDHSSASAKVHNQRSTLPVIGLTPEAVQDPLLVQVPSLPPRPVQSSSVPATRAWLKESFKPNSPPVLPARKLPPPLPERPSNPSPGDVFASEHQRNRDPES
ncbi:uncharacterized protein EI90DRAFT_1737685 [Cantharellus anzutake]|uniref:uncharacterized protein n=1 Tax=Cantharellus anzutake TaxID=1750568 RepID=UPI0019085EB4|nr:uncharacterized protein EI90DRAFT_1737685 [Cantharellus anzutake]KAF8341437.1 hypothetical protein EI90DRAFT_1737685 [Cantharellus anzutake]